MSPPICLGLEWRARFASDLHTSGLQCEFINKLLKSCGVKRRGLSPELGDIFTEIQNEHGKTPPLLSEKIISTAIEPPLTAHEDIQEEELWILRETVISSFRGDGRNWDMEALGGAGGSCHQLSWTGDTARFRH